MLPVFRRGLWIASCWVLYNQEETILLRKIQMSRSRAGCCYLIKVGTQGYIHSCFAQVAHLFLLKEDALLYRRVFLTAVLLFSAEHVHFWLVIPKFEI